MALLIKLGDFVGPGEEKTATYLQKNLPDDWVVVCNKELVRPASVRELDFIIVGQHSIFAVEEKHWWGSIHGTTSSWVLDSGESQPSPLRQADEAAKRLTGYLKDAIPSLREEQRRTGRRFVAGRVILSAEPVSIFVNDPRVHTQVLRLPGCEYDLIRFEGEQASVLSIQPFRPQIIERLADLPDRPEIPKRVGPYRVLEVLSTLGLVRRFRAEHEDGSERILKLFPRRVVVDPDAIASERNLLLREYEALRRLRETGRVPSVDPYFSWDQDQVWVVPVHPVHGRSLRADRTGAPPSDEERIQQVLMESFTTLFHLHNSGVVHRGLTPDRIILQDAGPVMVTDLLIARVPDMETIAATADELDPNAAYRAPECRGDLGAAEPASDVYSLALSLVHWLTGYSPEEDGEAPSAKNLLQDAGLVMSELAALLDRCLSPRPTRRPTAEAFVEELSALRTSSPQGFSGKHAEPGLFAPGEIVSARYRIIRQLGAGATAVTYLAEDIEIEVQVVLKVIRSPDLTARLAKAEFLSLRTLSHPNLIRVYEVWPTGFPVHLKLEYVRGSSLRDIGSQFRGNVDACVWIGEQILSGLAYLAERGMVHRDISPGNVLVPDEESGHPRLIDFGLATEKSETSSAVGTPRYRAPEVESRGHWTHRCDLYALGVVLFELLTGRLPYEVSDGVPRKEQPRPSTPDEGERFGEPLMTVLMKATSPDPTRRYQTAIEFRDALLAARRAAGQLIELPGTEVLNPVVDDIRRLYRNSEIGNPDNRGIDSDFASQTYVLTRLDTELLPRLIAGEFRLLILTGNPGDGKTSFLQRLGRALTAEGAHLENEDDAGWHLRFGDHLVAALYDASESHGEKGSDVLLNEILAPLEGSSPLAARYTAIIAANDGRLIDFFERYGATRFSWVWEQVRTQLFSPEKLFDDTVCLVDLKFRSLVSLELDETSIFARVLDKLVGDDRWKQCQGCVARLECPVRFNALSLQEKPLADVVRQRLHSLLLAIHLRRERRPTLRDLRSALAFLITHDLGCKDVHRQRREGKVPLSETGPLYFSSAFDSSGSPDLVLDDLLQLDPAPVASPRLERFFHFHREESSRYELLRVFLDADDRPAPDLPLLEAASGWVNHLKRRYFFEGKPEGDSDGRAIPAPESLFPYRFFGEFVRALMAEIDDALLVKRLLFGISRADGVTAIPEGDLALRVTERQDSEVVVVKLFPVGEFEIRRTHGPPEYVEWVRDHLVLEHKSGQPRLLVSLDLFEFLLRSSEGLLPGPEESQALIEDLTSFRNQLLARPATEVVILEGQRIHRVRLENGVITRKGSTG
ncbi:MAG: protein kinase domain-containing protein [Gammaproteobacteria bacterium]